MELGLATFADLALGAGPKGAARRLRELLEEIELADQLGLEVFGLGEHHRPDYAVSATAVALAAAAARTEKIRLTSAVTVLSSADPVRVFQDFATLDLLSGGRAEIMAGRGSFIESFPLFGLDLEDYDELFAEKLELLLALRESERVTWSGRHRAPLRDIGVYPRPLQQPLPVWIAVGGSPGSVVRAGALGLPLMLAIIGGAPARFAPLIDLYRQALRGGDTTSAREEDGVRVTAPSGATPPGEGSGTGKARAAIESATGEAAGRSAPAIGINSHTYLAPTSQRAADEYFPAYSQVMNRIGRERGWSPMTRRQFDAACGPEGHLLVGSPQQVAEKILAEHELFHHDRFLAQISIGTLPHERVMRATELFGSEVAPVVRAALLSPDVRTAQPDNRLAQPDDRPIQPDGSSTP
ncbi:MAG TPA: LLM class flavin-dependent oxidoreductase [Solirubrobacteraceae bacterium]|jgi:alkanesulfonate monooxygenase SsuD/methylene tetrahydromethanopterin reductase-like flavin-dependent oxidoreductase (luciferase family)|nr:LLM class flavin-dependent oxidoreductase [Solirubrobacteraceae bacterium]